MKKTYVEKVLVVGVLALFAYLPFHPFATAWVGSLTEIYAPIKIWKDVLVALVAVSLTVYSLAKPQLRSVIWRDHINLLVVGYAALHFLLVLVYGSLFVESAIAGLIFNLRFLAFFLSIRIILTIFPRKSHELPTSVSRVLLVSALIVGGIAMLQLAFPLKGVYEFFGYDGVNTIAPATYVDNNPAVPRAFSTLRGPNELGAFMILPMCAAVTALLYGFRRKLMGVLLAVFTLALLASYSRSALVGAAIAILALLLFFYGGKLPRRVQVTALLTALIVGIALFWASLVVPQVRLFIFHSSPQDPTLFEGSTEDHFRAIAAGGRDVIDHPLGRGPGEAGPASFYQTDEAPRIPENYYVQIAQETGLLGLGLFVSIVGVVALRLLRNIRDALPLVLISSLIGLSVTSLFLHSWADDPTAYVWWGLAAVVLSYYASASTKKTVR